MRAISVFSLDAGTSTFGWRAWIALRTRVSMSAMGSLVIRLLQRGREPGARAGASRTPPWPLVPGPRPPVFLPARLDHAWNLAVQRELPETQAANAELAQIPPRP